MEQPEMEETSARGKLWDVGDGRTMTVAEIARETSRSVQAVRQQLAKGIRGEALLEPNQKTATRKLETPISGWSDEQLYWLRQGLTPYAGAYDGKPADFEDDRRVITWRPRRTYFDSLTGKEID